MGAEFFGARYFPLTGKVWAGYWWLIRCRGEPDVGTMGAVCVMMDLDGMQRELFPCLPFSLLYYFLAYLHPGLRYCFYDQR